MVAIRVRLTSASNFVPKSPFTAISGLIPEHAAVVAAPAGSSSARAAAEADDWVSAVSAPEDAALEISECAAG